jgi:hypothetical protein
MPVKRNWIKGIFLILILFLTACGIFQRGGTSVWIDVPLNDLTISPQQIIDIKGHAFSLSGIRNVEILVNSVLFMTVEDLTTVDNLASFEALWSPDMGGDYLIEVVAHGVDGDISEPDSATIHVGSDGPTTTQQITPTLTTTTITPTVSMTMTGTVPSETLTTTATMTSTLLPHTPTSTSTPVPDTATPTITSTPPDLTPPPAPQPSVPADGLSLSCRANQSLVWLPVTDPSGISEYEVEFQRRSSENDKWSTAAGSPIVTPDHNTQISVQCGWYYRWRVSAQDGAGNMSEWSSWSYFDVSLN